jgi:hypothetical protein
VRGRTSFALTPIGELLFAHAEALGKQLQLAETQIDEALAEERQRLRIGAFPSILGVLLPNAIAQLSRALGPLEITVQGAPTSWSPVCATAACTSHCASRTRLSLAASTRGPASTFSRSRWSPGRSTTPAHGPTVAGATDLAGIRGSSRCAAA